MRQKVTRRAKTRKADRIGKEGRGRQQRRLREAVAQTVRGVVRQQFEEALQAEVTELVGRAKGERRNEADATEVLASCNRCGTTLRRQFCRAGFYPRGLLTLDAAIPLNVPRVSCVCGGMVSFEFALLVPYNRVWFDLEERARELAALGLSLRDSVEVLAWSNRQPLGITTLNARVNQVAPLAEAFHQGTCATVPPVLMLDGIWLKLLVPTGEEFVDRQGRQRLRHKLQKIPVLVAYGVDPHRGKRWVLDWERGEGEDAASWQRLLERLVERGVTAERGLELIVHDGSAGLDAALETVWLGDGVVQQRCVFHKLRNVRRDVLGDAGMSPEERRERRRAVLRDAAQVYHGQDEAEMHKRLRRFHAKWEEREPKAVATLERDFDRTVAYLTVQERAKRRGQDWRVEDLRTTSPLERVQRHFRQKARQIVLAHSEVGLEVAIRLVIAHRRLDQGDPQPWAARLEDAMLSC